MTDSGDGGEGGGDELPCATKGEGGEDCVLYRSALLSSTFYGMHCIHRSRDSQCFTMDETTPNIASSRWGSRPISNNGYMTPVSPLPNGISIASAGNCTKTAEPIEMPFGADSRGPLVDI